MCPVCGARKRDFVPYEGRARVRIAIVATRTCPRRRRLPVERLRDADLILHAGDLSTVGVLEELEAIGPPVAAVYGNVDEPALRERLPEERIVDADGVRIAMLHDAGPAKGRLERLRSASPAPTRWSSATPTSRCTKSATAFRSSTPAARPTAAASRATRWDRRDQRRAVRFRLVVLD